MTDIRKRSVRDSVRWRKGFVKERNLHRELKRYAGDILESENFNKTKTFIQHGNVTVNSHCVSVAKCSLGIARKLKKVGISYNKRDLIRGALLHDYFLYDWHDPDHVQLYNLHGFKHPYVALKNAKKEYKLTKREAEIIQKHMWPLTVVPPTCREAWIVTWADKWCSLLETFHINKGHGAKKLDTKTENGKIQRTEKIEEQRR